MSDLNRYSSLSSSCRPLGNSPYHHSVPSRPLGSAGMTGSSYSTSTQFRPDSTPGSDLGRLLPAARCLKSFVPHSQYQNPNIACSPYSSAVSTTSAESPLSAASSANESPLPEPLTDMDYDVHAQIVSGNDDWCSYLPSDDVAVPGYQYGNAPCAYPPSTYATENPDIYKQPVSGLLPMNVSAAMRYSWSPLAKRFQPLFPQGQQNPRGENNYSSPLAAPPSLRPVAGTACSPAQPFASDFEKTDLVYPPTAPSPQHSITAPVPQSHTTALADYMSTQHHITVKQETESGFPEFYDRGGDAASSSHAMEVLSTSYESGSTASPSSESNILPSMPYVQNSVAQSAIATMPILSAPIPRHSAYYGGSLVTNCERTCHDQEHEQHGRQALRVNIEGLQQQRTVRPAEVSPVTGFSGLPNVDDDAEGEPDEMPFNLHEDDVNDGCSTGHFHTARVEGVVGCSSHPGRETAASTGTVSEDEDAEGVEDYSVHGGADDYRLDLADEQDEDDEDGDFVPRRHTTSRNTRGLRARSLAGRNPVRHQPYGFDGSVKRASKSPLISASDLCPGSSGKSKKNARTLPIPVPVPNLTKKSRGRRVPTVQTINNCTRGQRDATLSARIYLCDVSGCGKCFARGEHLKRHIRSIHTHEKPHRCPFPGCGKEFSRHDNLGQHMKVHKDASKLLDRVKAGEA